MVGMIEFIFFRLATAVKSFNMKPYRKSNNRIIKKKKNTLDRTHSVHEKSFFFCDCKWNMATIEGHILT